MTSLPEPPTSIPVQLCSRILWASPAPGPCGLGRSLIDLSLVWLPKRPGYGGQTRVLSRNASESPEKSVCAGGQSYPSGVFNPLQQELWPPVERRLGDLWGNGKTDSLARANA